MFCCARYSDDGAWYRAQVTAIDSTNQTATVRFVDHGNTDVVNLSSDLRHLSADLSRSPCQAIPCSLARGAWSPEQCSSFEAAAMNKPLQVTFNEYVDNIWLVTLKDGSVSLNQLLAPRRETPCWETPCCEQVLEDDAWNDYNAEMCLMQNEGIFYNLLGIRPWCSTATDWEQAVRTHDCIMTVSDLLEQPCNKSDYNIKLVTSC